MIAAHCPERKCVLAAVFGLLRRQGHNLGVEIETIPPEAGDFRAALASQNAKLNDRAERKAERFGSVPDRFNFVIGKEALPRGRSVRQGHTLARAAVEPMLAHGEAEEYLGGYEGMILLYGGRG